jgi:hypothetical protein
MTTTTMAILCVRVYGGEVSRQQPCAYAAASLWEWVSSGRGRAGVRYSQQVHGDLGACRQAHGLRDGVDQKHLQVRVRFVSCCCVAVLPGRRMLCAAYPAAALLLLVVVVLGVSWALFIHTQLGTSGVSTRVHSANGSRRASLTVLSGVFSLLDTVCGCGPLLHRVPAATYPAIEAAQPWATSLPSLHPAAMAPACK